MNTEEIEVIKPIKLTDSEKHKEYILDFTRDTVSFAESYGFNWDEVGNKPATMIPLIWWVAFRRYQPKLSRTETDKILESIGGVSEAIILRLRELYDQSLTSLVNIEDEQDPNSRWGMEM